MLEKIIIALIVACCAFFIGRRFYRQWRRVALGNEIPCCTDGCSSCSSVSTCDSRTVNDNKA
ncbi:MAG: FeoB-associated Cys-rich membrane protein [Deltaproteobacteria bacterium]|nr:FeoB-associated Cys-rich membrane protein [Deltaproteobacteria bacterium]